MVPCVLLEKHRLALLNQVGFTGFRVADYHRAHQHEQHFGGGKDGAERFRMPEPGAGGQAEHRLVDFVVGLDRDFAIIDHTFRNRDARHRHDPATWTKQSGQGGHIIHAQIIHRPAARFVKPRAPVRAGPAIEATRRQGLPNIARLDMPPHVLIGERQGDIGGADQMAF